MRQLFALIIGFLFFANGLSGAPAGAAESATALTVRETGAGIYARQDAESAPITRLEKGEELFPMMEAVGREIWYMVRTKGGQVGWVRGSEVEVSNQARDAFREKESGTSTWSARTAGGRTFSGTWSIAPGTTDKAASGAWTLSGSGGATVMRGTWSLEKHSTGWNGVWHAAAEGREGELVGSWSAELPHVRNAPFREMFEAAVKEALRGLWTGASESGSWSLRYVKPQPSAAPKN